MIWTEHVASKPLCLLEGACPQEVFTYLDRVVSDNANFLRWLEQEAAAKKAAESAWGKMRAHPQFGTFCAAVGVSEENWGRPGCDHAAEVLLFEEWLAVSAAALASRAAGSIMDTMETQPMGEARQASADVTVMLSCMVFAALLERMAE